MSFKKTPSLKNLVFFLVRTFILLKEKVEPTISALRFRALIKNAGRSCSCHYSVEIKYPEKIIIGNNSKIGPKATLGAYGSITIGSNVVVSKSVLIESAGLNFRDKEIPYKHKGNAIIIEDNVWIGANSIILGGVIIGKGSVVGAGVTVFKSIPENSIVVQSPCRIIKKNTKQLVKKIN